MAVEFVTANLESCTVFWEDINVTQKQLETWRRDDAAANRAISTIEKWLRENVKRPFRIYAKGVWFLEKADAALFKIFWHDGMADE